MQAPEQGQDTTGLPAGQLRPRMPPPTKELLERLEKEDGGYDRDDCLKALLEAKGDEAEALAHLRRSRAGATGNVDETTPTSISPANVAIEVQDSRSETRRIARGGGRRPHE